MATRSSFCAAVALVFALSACGDEPEGPIAISAIGGAPKLANPNLKPLDPPSALLTEAVAQGLVRFDGQGQIEPALAQRWIVSDDGLRYTFRLKRARWPDGTTITAQYVAGRLRAALSQASRNPLKPVLGAIGEIEAMTDEVIEIALKSPRANFLQLLAQPEMAVLRGSDGSGPYRIAATEGALATLEAVLNPEAAEDEQNPPPAIRLRGEKASLAIARFADGEAELVTGGTAGDLPIAQAARLPAARLLFDPAAGLFGLAFVRADGAFADAGVRTALAMAVDRTAIVAALGAPGLQPRSTMTAPGVHELPQPTAPEWAASSLVDRQAMARRTLGELTGSIPLRVRVAMPDGPGYRLIFAYLRRDWRMIGVDAERVAANAPADLRFLDQVAPINLASWYLRSFSCASPWICDPAADVLMEQVRNASPSERRTLLADADRALLAATPFIAIAAPVRWSLVAPRLTGFRSNPLARHPAGELLAASP